MLDDCKLIELQVIRNELGYLAVCEGQQHSPFEIKRVYWLYNVPAGAVRGGHAHKQLQQIIVAVAGSFDVHVDDGFNRKKITLNRPSKGLYIPTMTWREIDNFAYGSSCLVLASEHYEEADYYREYDIFKKHVHDPV